MAGRLERNTLFLGLLLVLLMSGRSLEAATLRLNTAHILLGLALLVVRVSQES